MGDIVKLGGVLSRGRMGVTVLESGATIPVQLVNVAHIAELIAERCAARKGMGARGCRRFRL